MSHHFESTWSAHKQKQHNCTHKGADVGNFALIWSVSLPSFDGLKEIKLEVRRVHCQRSGSHAALPPRFRWCLAKSAVMFSRSGSFPDNCDAAWLPFNAGDNSAPAASTSCVRREASSSPAALSSTCRWWRTIDVPMLTTMKASSRNGVHHTWAFIYTLVSCNNPKDWTIKKFK